LAIARSIKGLFCGLLLSGLLALPALAENQPLAELWFQTSAEYRALSYQTYRMAEMQFDRWSDILEKRADGKAYLPGSVRPVAIVLDLDETVIDNSGFQAFCARQGTSFNDELWLAWVEFQGLNEKAGPAVPGAPEFLRKVEAMGVTPIYISNRNVGQEGSTINVLRRLGINVDNIEKRMLLRLPSKEESARAEALIKQQGLAANSPEAARLLKGEGKKEARRQLISRDYDVIAYFGDQMGDFDAFVQTGELTAQSFQPRRAQADEYRRYWGTQWFMLPNPMYGYWGPGQTLPANQPTDALEDYGFEVYVRGSRQPATTP
jgi:predicted secreted acid phosphatase